MHTKLVVSSAAEYVATALAIAHTPRLRARHTAQLLARLPMIFNHPAQRLRAVHV